MHLHMKIFVTSNFIMSKYDQTCPAMISSDKLNEFQDSLVDL